MLERRSRSSVCGPAHTVALHTKAGPAGQIHHSLVGLSRSFRLLAFVCPLWRHHFRGGSCILSAGSSREGAVVLIVVSALGLFSSIPKYHVLTDVTGKFLGRLIHEQALSEDAAGLSAPWHPV